MDAQNYIVEAQAAHKFFHEGLSTEEIKFKFRHLREDVSIVSKRKAGLWEAFSYRRQLVIGCGLVLLQQISGQPAILYYSTNIFKAAGFRIAALCSVLVGFAKVVATLCTAWRVDKWGRRHLLVIGLSVMIVALIALAIGIRFSRCTLPEVDLWSCPETSIYLESYIWGIVIVSGLMLFVVGYQIGFGPIAWLMISEVFPLNVRSAAMSLAVVVNFSANIFMTFCQASLFSALTISGTMMLYCGLCVVSVLFVYFLVPETRGKTLEEIDSMLTVNKCSAGLLDGRRMKLQDNSVSSTHSG